MPVAAMAVAGILAWIGLTVGWLTIGGAIAAFVVASLIFIGTGLAGGVLLAIFFVSGSLLTYSRTHPNQAGGRQASQVLANAGWAAGASGLVALGWTCGWSVLIGSLAAAQADTWATEVGQTAPGHPRLITTGNIVPRGSSGAISLRGTLAGSAGAATMSLTGLAVGLEAYVVVGAALGGVTGMLADSLVGATAQAKYQCQRCSAVIEVRDHCHHRAARVRGIPGLDNDVVNVIGSGVGALVALVLAALV